MSWTPRAKRAQRQNDGGCQDRVKGRRQLMFEMVTLRIDDRACLSDELRTFAGALVSGRRTRHGILACSQEREKGPAAAHSSRWTA